MNGLHDLVNNSKAKATRGDISIGCFLLSASSFIAETMAHHPLDWMVIDMEASHASKKDLLHILQALNAYDITPVVRVSSHDKHLIESSLDFGARGIVVPKVDTAAQAGEATSACFYPPRGNRGINCIRASAFYTRAKQYFDRANDSTLLIVQIESSESVDNVFEIADVPNVDVLFMGPGDLAASYGQNGVVTGPVMDRARGRVLKACRRSGKIAGIFAHNVESANQYIDEGFTFIAIGNDIKYLSLGLTLSLSHLKRPKGFRQGTPGAATGGERK